MQPTIHRRTLPGERNALAEVFLCPLRRESSCCVEDVEPHMREKTRRRAQSPAAERGLAWRGIPSFLELKVDELRTAAGDGVEDNARKHEVSDPTKHAWDP